MLKNVHFLCVNFDKANFQQNVSRIQQIIIKTKNWSIRIGMVRPTIITTYIYLLNNNSLFGSSCIWTTIYTKVPLHKTYNLLSAIIISQFLNAVRRMLHRCLI